MSPSEALEPIATQGAAAAKQAAAGSLIHYPPSYFQPLDLAQLFAEARPLELELGSGDGSFIVAYAAAHPDCNFIAVERLLGRLRKIDRKGQRARLDNLRALRIEAS